MPYTPKPPPRTKPEFQDLYDYIEQELQSISRELLGSSELELRTTAKEPVRPREGMIVQADGTDWDPGEGAGTYKYENGAWVKFGDADHVHTLADVTDAGALAALDEVALTDIADIATQRTIGRNTAGTGAPEQVSLTQMLDWIGSAAQGDILIRGASAWSRLALGSSGDVLTAGATDPSWEAPHVPWTEIQVNNPTSGTASDFTDIPADYRALLILGEQLDFSANSGSVGLLFGTSNTFASTHSIYTGRLSVVESTVQGSGLDASTDPIYVANASSDATTYFMALILDYKDQTEQKHVFTLGGKVQANDQFMITYSIVRTTSQLLNIRVNSSSPTFVGGRLKLIGLF